MGSSVPLRAGNICWWIAAATLASPPSRAITFDGDISYTSDYIFRGISQTGGRGAGQLDVRLSTADGTFAGVFASTLSHLWWRRGQGYTGWNYELEGYLGHRFDLSPSWSITTTGTSYSYVGGDAPTSNDYQELSVTTAYLDLWTVELAWIPNAVRADGYGTKRYPAVATSTSVQVPLIGRLAATAGVGYYLTDHDGYGFGNVGLAFEFKRLRFDAGYYVAEERAATLFPYGRAGSRYAATVSYHF